MKKFIFFFLFFSSSFAFATEDPYALHKQISQGMTRNNAAKIVYGEGWRVKMENEWHKPPSNADQLKKMVERSIAVEKPKPSSIGKSMMTRIKSLKGGLGGVLGGVAVSALIESIGWVMEDGAYVKYKEKEDDDNCESCEKGWYGATQINGRVVEVYKKTSDEVCSFYSTGDSFKDYTYSNKNMISIEKVQCVFKSKLHPDLPNWDLKVETNYTKNPHYKPDQPDPEKVKVVLTDEQVGQIMLGDGYSDPVDKNLNSKINTGDWTGVTDVYTSDPTGVGNENADRMDEKLKNAKPTENNKPSYKGDPVYDETPPLDEKDTSKDRKWDESGDEATGETKPTVDPETGQQTGGQSISLQFPAFCTWASTMCKWYDDWKKSDKVYKDHMTKTEEHQKDEKSFWEKVTDWFDWTKEEPDDKEQPEQPEIDDKGIFARTFDTVFSLSKQCPPDLPWSLDAYYFKGTYTINLNWLCMIFTFLGYPLVLASHCIGLWIMYEAVIRKEIKW